MRTEGHDRPRVLAFATQGVGSRDEDRIRELLRPLGADVLAYHRRGRAAGVLRLVRALMRERPDAVVMEGTGVAGGVAVLLVRVLAGIPYVVSSGDAVAPYIRAQAPALWPAALLYEWLLCRCASGFVGWSPYLAGRALTFGTPRAMTAANWADVEPSAGDGAAVRTALGISPEAVVFGIVGSLNWSARYGYCYGLELVRAVRRVARTDVHVLVVGDGDGRERLLREAGSDLRRRVSVAGAVARDRLGTYLAAIDVASLPQSVDGVGAFRYTTKISEYLAARLPVVTGQIPLGYDLDDGWLWRLPGDAPWDDQYVDALGDLMATISRDDIERHRPPAEMPTLFSAARQRSVVCAFVEDVVARERQRTAVGRA